MSNKLDEAKRRISKIEEIRKENGLNQTEFAKSINLSKQMYYKTTLNQRGLQIKDLEEICIVYNINSNWLLFNAGLKEAIDNNLNNESQLSHIENRKFPI